MRALLRIEKHLSDAAIARATVTDDGEHARLALDLMGTSYSFDVVNEEEHIMRLNFFVPNVGKVIVDVIPAPGKALEKVIGMKVGERTLLSSKGESNLLSVEVGKC